MAVIAIERLRLFAHDSVKTPVLSALQEAGVVHLEEAGGTGAALRSAPGGVDDLDVQLHRLERALQGLSEFERTNGLRRMLAGKPRASWAGRVDAMDGEVRRIVAAYEDLDSRRTGLQADIKALEKEIEILSPLLGLDLPVRSLAPTETSEVRIAVFPSPELEPLTQAARERPLHLLTIRDDQRNVYALAAYHRDAEADLDALFKDHHLTFLSLDPFRERAAPGDRVAGLVARMEDEIAGLQAELERLGGDFAALAAHRPRLMTAHDCLLSEREMRLSLGYLGATERVVRLEGWVPVRDKAAVARKLEAYADAVHVEYRAPAPDEDPPVVLDNPPLARPFEIITKLYGLPDRGIPDPTAMLAPFFWVYVGLCVSEAGYGAVVAILSALFLKFAKTRGPARQFAWLGLLLGISNIIFGTLFGGWFGFPIRSLLLIDPLRNPVAFLGLSLALGFLQVWIGTLLNAINAARHRAWGEVIVKSGWLIMLPAGAAYLATRLAPLGYLALAGMAGILFFTSASRNPFARVAGGLYGLYGISGYLADTLSYSRILALGLSTGVIAMVVNNLTVTAGQIPVVGWVFGALIFLGGHLFNLAIGFLGGFVHSMRLQFVEFFTKFYRAGGKVYKPFQLECKYIEFIE